MEAKIFINNKGMPSENWLVILFSEKIYPQKRKRPGNTKIISFLHQLSKAESRKT